MNKHKIMRKHISAAKNWLSQAEDSIEEENEIRSDLKLMLAQAELKRAQEKAPQPWLIWGRRLAPLLAAIVLALGYFLYQNPMQEPGSAVNAGTDAVVQQPAMNVSQEAAMQVAEQRELQEIQGSSGMQANENDVPQAAAAETGAAVTQYTDALPVTERQEVQQAEAKPEVPSARMQELMQNAGSILRE